MSLFKTPPLKNPAYATAANHTIFFSISYHQARSQDLRKGVGGFFERLRKVQTTLTLIFIVLQSESHGISRKHRKFHRFSPKKKRSSPNLSLNFRPKSGTQPFFQTKNRRFPKKKKVFTEFEFEFSAKIGNSNVFSDQKQVVSKKKNKVFTEFESDFTAKIGNSNVFSDRPLHTLHNFGTQFPLGGAVFNFHQKRAILHTSQANGGAIAPFPPPPSWLRYCLPVTTYVSKH